MEEQKKHPSPFDSIMVTPELVDELASRDLLNLKAKNHAFSLLYPHRNWRELAEHFLMCIGCILILAGIIYFFAFNWSKITPHLKFGIIEIALTIAIGLTYFKGLKNLTGKVLLTTASILVGVFLAVFGQIYQTGADVYSLFMIWSGLIFPWVIISEFTTLWAIWLLIVNISICLFWFQNIPQASSMYYIFLISLIAFNSAFAALREHFVKRKHHWLNSTWSQTAMVIAVLFYSSNACITFIGYDDVPIVLTLAGVLGVVAHIIMFHTYLHRIPNILPLTITMFSTVLIVEFAVVKIFDVYETHPDFCLLILGFVTLILLILSIKILTKCIKIIEAKNV